MILVTGATGQCGGALARRLAQQGQQVKALTRKLEQPAVGELLAQGIEVVRGDLLDPGTLTPLFEEVELAFLVTTPQAGFEEEVLAGVNFIDAAKAAGLQHLVFLSVIYAETTTPHCSTKGKIEAYLRKSGIPYTILRAGYFLETIPNYFSETELKRRTIVSIIKPDAKIHWIAIEDIGRAAGQLILRNRAENRTYDLVSPECFSMLDVARVFGEVTGINLAVEYTPVSTEDLLRGLAEAGFLDRAKAMSYLEGIGDPQSDYHAAVNNGEIKIDPSALVGEIGLSFITPEAYVRQFSTGVAGKAPLS